MHKEFFNTEELKDYRRSLRNTPTRAEHEMWQGLRKRRTGGYKFRRQHSIGNYIADFYCPELRLVIEVDGISHDDPSQKKYDAKRTAFFEEQGIREIRFTDGEVLLSVDRCMERIMEFIK